MSDVFSLKKHLAVFDPKTNAPVSEKNRLLEERLHVIEVDHAFQIQELFAQRMIISRLKSQINDLQTENDQLLEELDLAYGAPQSEKIVELHCPDYDPADFHGKENFQPTPGIIEKLHGL